MPTMGWNIVFVNWLYQVNIPTKDKAVAPQAQVALLSDLARLLIGLDTKQSERSRINNMIGAT